MRKGVKEIAAAVLDLFYPPRCVFCEELLPAGRKGVCEACEKALPRPEHPDGKKNIPYVDRCLYAFVYEGLARESLLRYKFSGHSAHAGAYSEFIYKILCDYSAECDIITWVPLSRKRKRKRGYDQARLIAAELAPLLGRECRRLLKKTVNNPAQSGTKGMQERRENVRGVYAACSPERFAGKTVLLVDDIITTGSTVSECARILKEAGAAAVIAVSLAGTELKEKHS